MIEIELKETVVDVTIIDPSAIVCVISDGITVEVSQSGPPGPSGAAAPHMHEVSDLAPSGALAGQAIVFDGVVWAPATISGGGGAGPAFPAGNSGEFQYNDGGAAAGAARVRYDGGTLKLVPGASTADVFAWCNPGGAVQGYIDRWGSFVAQDITCTRASIVNDWNGAFRGISGVGYALMRNGPINTLFQSPEPTHTPLVVQAASAQSSSLLEWRSSVGTTLGGVQADGAVSVGGCQFRGRTQSAGAPTTAQLPNANDWCFHKVTGGALLLAFNDGGTVRTVALV